jgi:FkbM family methyltransferase
MKIQQIFDENVKKWFEDKGDAYLRINYPEINSNSVVFDVGGYMGSFTESIYTRFSCSVYIFEPVKEFYDVCNFKFCHIPKIKILNYGISSKSCESLIYLSGDASSTTSINGASIENIELREISRVIRDLEIKSIDLLKINIEGEEYNLLEKLIQFPELLEKIKNIQVQYHPFIPDCDNRRNRINSLLMRTHECNWSYDWVWENWKLR